MKALQKSLFREDNFVTYPLTKDSPFTKSIAITLERLRSHGIIDYIWRKHLPLIDKEKCKEPKVSFLHNCRTLTKLSTNHVCA